MMKKNNIIKYLLPIVLAGVFTSCKDSYPQPDFSTVPPIIELPVASPAGDAGGNYMSEGITASATPTDIYIIVNYAAPNPNTSDVTVTLAVDSVGANSVFGKYKAVHDTIPPLPANAFSLSNTVTIPKGVGKVEYHIKINTSAIPDITKTYALPLKIVSASSGTISGNFGTLVLLIGVKNAYDGTYTLTGNVTRNSATGPDLSLGGSYKAGLTTHVTTLTSNTDSFTQYWRDGSGVAGIDGLYLTVDPATNKVTVASTSNAVLKNTDGYNNHYDPTTKTFYLAFDWGVSPNTRLAVDTLVYTGP